MEKKPKSTIHTSCSLKRLLTVNLSFLLLTIKPRKQQLTLKQPPPSNHALKIYKHSNSLRNPTLPDQNFFTENGTILAQGRRRNINANNEIRKRPHTSTRTHWEEVAHLMYRHYSFQSRDAPRSYTADNVRRLDQRYKTIICS